MLSPTRFLARGTDAALTRSGSAWPPVGQTAELLRGVGEFEEQIFAELLQREVAVASRPAVDRTSDQSPRGRYTVCLPAKHVIAADPRNSRGPVVRLPDSVLEVAEVRYQGVTYDHGADFLQEGRHLVFSQDIPSFQNTRFTFLGLLERHLTLSRFWSNVYHYRDTSPGSERFYRAMVRITQQTCGTAQLCELLAAAVGVPCVSHQGVVLDILEKEGFAPVVITQHESLAGQVGDIPTVEVGQTLYRGDLVFDSLRFHDFIEPPPYWLNRLTIPPGYFGFQAQGSLAITTTPQPPAGVVELDGLVHLQIPWEGSPNDQAAFHAQLKANEQFTRKTLMSVVAQGSATAATIATTDLNWLEVLWSTWLRLGVSVSQLRDKPSPVVSQRLSQVRRAIPPWTAHLIQYLQPPDNRDELC